MKHEESGHYAVIQSKVRRRNRVTREPAGKQEEEGVAERLVVSYQKQQHGVPTQPLVVICQKCGWEGYDKDTLVGVTADGEETGKTVCPECLSPEWEFK